MLNARSIFSSSTFLRFAYKNDAFASSRNVVPRMCLSYTQYLTCEEKSYTTAATKTAVTPENLENNVEVTFTKKNGERITVKGKKGDSLLDLVVNNNLDFDGYGACEGTLTCSTCHVILQQSDFDSLEKPSDDELDMLDLAYELTNTSRLGCQIVLSEKLNGLEVKLPSTLNDARS